MFFQLAKYLCRFLWWDNYKVQRCIPFVSLFNNFHSQICQRWSFIVKKMTSSLWLIRQLSNWFSFSAVKIFRLSTLFKFLSRLNEWLSRRFNLPLCKAGNTWMVPPSARRSTTTQLYLRYIIKVEIYICKL